MKIPPLLLLLFLLLRRATAQKTFDMTESNVPDSPDSVTNFQPSLAVVIGMLAITFSLTFIVLLLLYAKFCHRAASAGHAAGQHQIHDGLHRSRSAAATAGLDKTAVESLPFFRFSSLKGARDGLECAVCLAKFEDIEVLRLLPKCKHAFHIDCIDQWLEKHATCPLCRRKVSGADDLSQCSGSLRFLWNPPPELRQDSGLELYVEREESHHGSSRFCIGSSFRKLDAAGGAKEEEIPIPPSMDCSSPPPSPPPPLHRFNHHIVFSDAAAALKSRWSNVSSSDIMFLNSGILDDAPSCRFPAAEQKSAEVTAIMDVKEEMERKRAFESKVREMKTRAAADVDDRPINATSSESKTRKLGFDQSSVNNIEKRSMSEIVVHTRFNTEIKESSSSSSSNVVHNNLEGIINLKEERMRRIWIPIARKTVQWFANRQSQSQSQQGLNQQRLNV